MRQFSSAALKNYIRKVDLKPGDCLVVSHREVLKQLQRMPALGFYVPVVFSEDGLGMKKASRAQILEILDRIDESQAAAEGIS
jgi:hypothetical protein